MVMNYLDAGKEDSQSHFMTILALNRVGTISALKNNGHKMHPTTPFLCFKRN